MDTIQSLYNSLKQDITHEHLQKITVSIIDRYRNKNYLSLRRYAPLVSGENDLKIEKLFALLMRHYHPDRLSFIHREIEKAHESGNRGRLQELHNIYFFHHDDEPAQPHIMEHGENIYTYGPEDFGYRETTINDTEETIESALYGDEEETTFVDAVNTMFFGGLEHSVSPADLKTIDGELDLSDYDIEILDGIEHCIYLRELSLSGNRIERIGKLVGLTDLTSLYLSHNNIDSIDPLAELENLQILDISFNNITDISALTHFRSLEYLNLMGNPVTDYTLIDGLIKRGVIVLFDGQVLGPDTSSSHNN